MRFARVRSVLRLLSFAVLLLPFVSNAFSNAANDGPIVIATISGTINPATDDYLKTAIHHAEETHARLFVLRLNTPGGLVPSMQSMVETLLSASVPSVVYVWPQGGGATSAGVFVTMAGNFAVMAPGTTIGAAHPVMGGGTDIQGDMREKIENYAVSLSRAIAEQRGRNVKWAEEAVRESVSITDRDAVAEKVVDFSASDLDRVLEELEGKPVTVRGVTSNLQGLKTATRQEVAMNLRQQVAALLADPNIAMLLGLGAMLGIGVELYHPGAIFPGVFGAICLVLSLIAGQVIPINTGGLVLLLLSAVFFVSELFIPSGVLGVAGVISMILGALYFVDSDQVWSASGFTIQRGIIGTAAAFVGGLLLLVSTVALRTQREKVKTGREGLVDQQVSAMTDFQFDADIGMFTGRVRVMGEIWRARMEKDEAEPPKTGDKLFVQEVDDGLLLRVGRNKVSS